MNGITDDQIVQYVETHIDTFHSKRLGGLGQLKLRELIINKNPYLFRSKNLVRVADLVKSLLDAHLSSQEETMFGDFLEGLAIYVAEQVHSGLKSGITGVDLEFVKNKARYIISIKSGPNWGNSSQVEKMRSDFRTATRVIQQGNPSIKVIAVNGCCYGRDANPNKGGYFKYCGQDFWELISNDRDLYTRIIEPLGQNAKQRNDYFMLNYAAAINRFALEFTQEFCDDAGTIDWDKLVRYSSAATPLLSLPVSKRAVNKLSAIENVCDVLRHWGWPNLSDRIVSFATNADIENEHPSPNLDSLRGFLIFLGTLQSSGNVDVSMTMEGLILAEWKFADDRSSTVTFLDTDHVSVAATTADGSPLQIRNSQRVTRKTAIKRLIEQGLFTMLENG